MLTFFGFCINMVTCTMNKNENKTIFLNNLSFLMKKNQINTSQLSKKTGIALMTLQRIVTGETTDPKLSLLIKIASYFNIGLESLLYKDVSVLNFESKDSNFVTKDVPVFSFDDLAKNIDIKQITSENWKKWQTIMCESSVKDNNRLFALESLPSFSPRFRQGNLIVLDPTLKPRDHDIILVKFKNTNEYTLRDLKIDPPNWQLHPIIPGSEVIKFANDRHEVAGTMAMLIVK